MVNRLGVFGVCEPVFSVPATPLRYANRLLALEYTPPKWCQPVVFGTVPPVEVTAVPEPRVLAMTWLELLVSRLK